MYHLTIPFVVLSFVSHVHSRFIDASVVPVNLIRHQRRGIDQSVLLENGKEAQKLNAKFATMDSNSQCSTGDSACISGGFSQCVGGKFVGGPCAQGSKCFALPLLLKKGTSLGCDTEADAISRISNTGATGGLTGAGDSGKTSQNNSSDTNPSGDNSVNGPQSDSTDKDDDFKGSTSTATTDANKNSTSMDSSTGSSQASDSSDSGTDEQKKSTPMDASSGASNLADPSASRADKAFNNSSDSSGSKLDSGKPLDANKNSTSPSGRKDQKNGAPAQAADSEDVEDLSFAKDKSGEKDCTDES